MKTIKKQCEVMLSQQIYGHPSREDQGKIERLEKMVLILADQVDKLWHFMPDH